MINGKKIEVCFNDDSLLDKVVQLGRHFQGLLAVKVQREGAPRIDFVEVVDKKRITHVTLSGQTSYTSLYWKMKDVIYGKSEFLKVRQGSKNRDKELKQFNDEKKRQRSAL